MSFNNSEFIRATDRATKAMKLVGTGEYFSLFEGLVKDQVALVSSINLKTYTKHLEDNNLEFANSVTNSLIEVTYTAYFVLLIRYTKEISLLFAPYTPDTIDKVCASYKTHYKPLVIKIKAVLGILEDEIVSNTLFEEDENIYSSLDEMWSDVKTLRQYLREALQYGAELDEQKKLEDSQVEGTATEKRKNYNLQIGLAFIALTATPFLQDGYNYAKKLLYDSTGTSQQQNVLKAQLKNLRNNADSIPLRTRDARGKALQNSIKSSRLERGTFKKRLSEK